MKSLFLAFSLILASFICAASNAADPPEPAALCARDKDLWKESVTISVDQNSGKNCAKESLKQNLTCNSFGDVLHLLSDLDSDPQLLSPVSAEVILSAGSYVTEGRFNISRDIYIRGKEGHTVEVTLLTHNSPLKYDFSLSFNNTRHVSLCNINFTGSHGVIGFDNVVRVEVNSSSFR